MQWLNLIKSVFLTFFLVVVYSCCVHDYSAAYSGDCARPLKVFPNKWYQSTLGFRRGAHLGGANRFENYLMFLFGGKDTIFIYLNLFSLIIFALLCWIFWKRRQGIVNPLENHEYSLVKDQCGEI